ncbi:MAG: transglycosylase SLT domain-containing protein [Peptostreptococcaceae bacterium]|nr:transglycosylase SLT domain-containing protein [Peptostreptococcaceae bacterium]
MVTRPKYNRYKIASVLGWLIIFTFFSIAFLLGRVTVPEKIVKEKIVLYEDITEKAPKLKNENYYSLPLSQELQSYIFELCNEEKIPSSLIMAMIYVESNFNPELVSDTNDYGLMQINIINHKWLREKYNVTNFLNPYQNVYCGVKLIGNLNKKYNDFNKSLMAYNMGEGGAKKAWNKGIMSSKYSRKVLSKMNEYEVAYDK